MLDSTSTQLELFTMQAVARAYAGSEQLSNDQLYAAVGDALGVDRTAMDARSPVGASGQKHSLAKRRVRWHQQTLKKLKLLEPVPGERGRWRLTTEGQRTLGPAKPGVALVAFCTRLGLALWASWEDVFPKLDESIALMVTSPPYPLARQRAYGNPTTAQYTDFIVRAMEPIVRNLLPGGSIALNLSNDIFEPGSPARSLYQERLVLAMCDRLGLHRMDTLIWHNPSKPPGPVQYASKTRQQLNAAYETVHWFTNDPRRCFADNRRVLEPHSQRHRALMAAGGEQRDATFCDGAYRLRSGVSFANPTAGRIPRNVMSIGHRDRDAQRCNQYARANGLQAHGAPMPLALADRLVRFMSRPGDLVVDPFAGRCTTGKAAEQNGRRWLCTERMGDYLEAAKVRFDELDQAAA